MIENGVLPTLSTFAAAYKSPEQVASVKSVIDNRGDTAFITEPVNVDSGADILGTIKSLDIKQQSINQAFNCWPFCNNRYTI